MLMLMVMSSSSISLLSAASGLYPGFYDKSCPSVFEIVKSGVESAVQKDPRMAASLLRLHFHDCFVNVSYIYIYICIYALPHPFYSRICLLDADSTYILFLFLFCYVGMRCFGVIG